MVKLEFHTFFRFSSCSKSARLSAMMTVADRENSRATLALLLHNSMALNCI